MFARFIFILLILLFLPFESQGTASCSKWVVIQAEDSCWKIADKMGITVNDLLSMNTEVDCDKLWVGEKLCTATSSGLSCKKIYKVVSRDTCYQIWTKNGLSEREFMEMNGKLNCGGLRPGYTVCIGV